MNDRRFDELAQSWATSLSRRTALRRLGGGILAASLLGLRRTGASARRRRAVGEVCEHGEACCSGDCRDGRCRCPKGRLYCDTVCRDLLADAADRLGVPLRKVEIAQAEPRRWPDASLGCPKAGEFYAQVITPGYRVVVAAEGRRLEYRTSEPRHYHFVRCR